MVFSNKIYIILCFSVVALNPVFVLADSNPITQNQSKIYITVKPNNTIIVQQPNNTNFNQFVQTLADNKSAILKGDTLIASATIVGFFGFGSFVAVRLRGSSIGRQGRLMQLVYLSSYAVIVVHLLVIYSIVVIGQVDSTFYTFVIGVTILAVAVIAGSISEITGLQVRDAILEALSVDRVHMRAERLRRLAKKRSPI